jgi:thiamine-phosphate pyrophosphorylase
MPLPVPPLLLISDRKQARRPLAEIAAAAFAGGCRWFSLRDKDLAADERRHLLAELVALGHRHGALVTRHDDIDTVATDADDGVHLPAGGDPAAMRARLPGALIGASAHSTGEAVTLLRAGADYVTLSPIFATTSKPGYGPALGLAGLAAAAAEASGPIVALGGINAGNALPCLRAGAGGVAVMGEVMRADDPEAVVRALLGAMAEGHTFGRDAPRRSAPRRV